MEKTPSELFSFPRFLFLRAADRCHLKLQRYFLIVKGRAGGGWRDRGTCGWVVKWAAGREESNEETASGTGYKVWCVFWGRVW